MNKLVAGSIGLLFIVIGCAHNPDIAKETTKQDTAIVSGTSGVPVLVAPEWYHDFGEVHEGTDYLHSFIVRNMGTGVLEIKEVVPG